MPLSLLFRSILPLLAVLELNYSEKLLAVLPAAWLAKDDTY